MDKAPGLVARCVSRVAAQRYASNVASAMQDWRQTSRIWLGSSPSPRPEPELMSCPHENPLHSVCPSPPARGPLGDVQEPRPRATNQWRASSVSRDALCVRCVRWCEARCAPCTLRSDKPSTTLIVSDSAK